MPAGVVAVELRCRFGRCEVRPRPRAYTTLRFSADRTSVELLLSRRHPLLFGTRLRAESAPPIDDTLA